MKHLRGLQQFGHCGVGAPTQNARGGRSEIVTNEDQIKIESHCRCCNEVIVAWERVKAELAAQRAAESGTRGSENRSAMSMGR